MQFWISTPTQALGTALAQNLAEKAADLDFSDSVMVAFFLPPDALPKIEVAWPPDSSILPPVEHHVTLAYLGKASSLIESGLTAEHILINLRAFAEEEKAVYGTINGWGRFNGDDADAVYLNFDAPTLPEFRQNLVDTLRLLAPPISSHGYTPHVTLAYVPKGEPVNMLKMPTMVKLTFSTITLSWGGEHHEVPLGSATETDGSE